MIGPDWQEGCPSCSFWADNFDGVDSHLAARDTAFAVVSNAKLDTLSAYKKRLGWSFTWVSAEGRSFSSDFAQRNRLQLQWRGLGHGGAAASAFSSG